MRTITGVGILRSGDAANALGQVVHKVPLLVGVALGEVAKSASRPPDPPGRRSGSAPWGGF